VAHLEKHTSIHAPVNSVFKYVIDPAHSAEWIIGMESMGNITGSAKGDHYDWIYKMAGMMFNGKSEIVDQKQDQLQVVHSRGGVESTWTFAFYEEGGDTVLNLAIDYSVPVPVLGKFAEKLILKQNEKATEDSLALLKKNLEK